MDDLKLTVRQERGRIKILNQNGENNYQRQKMESGLEDCTRHSLKIGKVRRKQHTGTQWKIKFRN
jgi:hypothetical protein